MSWFKDYIPSYEPEDNQFEEIEFTLGSVEYLSEEEEIVGVINERAPITTDLPSE